MLRRKLLVAVMALGLFLVGTGTAQAWDLIHDRSGFGRVTLRAWTRNYSQVAFVADHAGTKVNVWVDIKCRNGDTYSNNWTDGGNRFRVIVRGLRNSGRCVHTFRVVAKKSFRELDLALWAR
jgi:hypothetical protein